MSRLHPLIPVFLAATLIGGTGCEFLDQFEDGGGLVDVYAGHHPTARNGEFATHPGDYFELQNDEGWTVIVVDAYVTTTAVTLNRCDGGSLPAELYWGSLCENLIGADAQATGVGSVSADEGTYCSATVSYGPFTGEQGSTHATNADVVGATVYVAGVAKKGDLSVPFELASFGGLEVEVDLSAVENGGPLTLDHDQYVNERITLSKTYDRFFDGINFEELDGYDVDALLLGTLASETNAVRGTEILPE